MLPYADLVLSLVAAKPERHKSELQIRMFNAGATADESPRFVVVGCPQAIVKQEPAQSDSELPNQFIRPCSETGCLHACIKPTSGWS